MIAHDSSGQVAVVPVHTGQKDAVVCPFCHKIHFHEPARAFVRAACGKGSYRILPTHT